MNVKPSIGFILQARSDSTRLPRKIFKKVGELSILEHIWNSWQDVAFEKIPIIATTYRPIDDELADLAERIGYRVYRGDCNDVLSRFKEIADFFNLDLLLRFTGDNPVIDTAIVEKAIQRCLVEYKSGEAIFLSTRNSFMPIGMDIEIFSKPVLGLIPEPLSEYDAEHVTPWMYSNNDIGRLNLENDLPKNEFSVTVDTREDLNKLNEFYEWLNQRKPNAELVTLFYENQY
jgi:spore coat polysaccharide biosynthesis protein SpsF (cytidylyltransferase family)